MVSSRSGNAVMNPATDRFRTAGAIGRPPATKRRPGSRGPDFIARRTRRPWIKQRPVNRIKVVFAALRWTRKHRTQRLQKTRHAAYSPQVCGCFLDNR